MRPSWGADYSTFTTLHSYTFVLSIWCWPVLEMGYWAGWPLGLIQSGNSYAAKIMNRLKHVALCVQGPTSPTTSVSGQ